MPPWHPADRPWWTILLWQAEAALDPVAPKLKQTLNKDGKLPSKVPREYRKPKKGVTGGDSGGLAAKLDKLQEESKKNKKLA